MTSVVVPKGQISHPLASGAVRSIGLHRGQVADYRWTLADCSGAHVHEYADRYEVHRDNVAPGCSLLGHLRSDAPATLVALGALLGGLGGIMIARTRGACIGTFAGAVVGAMFIESEDDHGEADRAL